MCFSSICLKGFSAWWSFADVRMSTYVHEHVYVCVCLLEVHPITAARPLLVVQCGVCSVFSWHSHSSFFLQLPYICHCFVSCNHGSCSCSFWLGWDRISRKSSLINMRMSQLLKRFEKHPIGMLTLFFLEDKIEISNYNFLMNQKTGW